MKVTITSNLRIQISRYSLRRPIRRKALRHGTEAAPGPAAAADAARRGRPESRHGHFGGLVERVEGVVGGEVLAGVGAVGVRGVARLHHSPLHVRRLVLGQGRLPPRIRRREVQWTIGKRIGTLTKFDRTVARR